MCRWPVTFAVELRVVRLVLLEHVVNSREQHPGNGDNGLFMSPALLECKIAIADFRKFLGANRIEGALNKKWLDVSPSPADSGGFHLPGALIVLRRKPSPRAEVL